MTVRRSVGLPRIRLRVPGKVTGKLPVTLLVHCSRMVVPWYHGRQTGATVVKRPPHANVRLKQKKGGGERKKEQGGSKIKGQQRNEGPKERTRAVSRAAARLFARGRNGDRRAVDPTSDRNEVASSG